MFIGMTEIKILEPETLFYVGECSNAVARVNKVRGHQPKVRGGGYNRLSFRTKKLIFYSFKLCAYLKIL